MLKMIIKLIKFPFNIGKKYKRNKLIDVSVLEQKENKYLILRSFKHISIDKYLVCENYDFTTNTYPEERGINLFDIGQAYDIFNYFVTHNQFPMNHLDFNEKWKDEDDS